MHADRFILATAAFLLSVISGCAAEPGPRAVRLSVEWEAPVTVSAGGYGRVHRLLDGRLMCCYSRSGNDYVRFSSDEAATWSGETLAIESFDCTTEKGTATLRCSNPEFTQLSAEHPVHPGRIILAANLRPKDNQSTVHPFSIVCAVSDDGGATWSGRRNVYDSRTWDTDAAKGAWEPFVLELPDGTVQVYFTDNTPYYAAGDQRGNNISVVESTDGGDSWGPERIVCHSEGGWDGMPVVTLVDGRLYLSVEHKDVRGGTVPMNVQLMSCTVEENWPEEITLRSPRRFWPYTPSSAYEGAPYVIHTDHYFVVSCQSALGSETPLKDTHAVPEVSVCPISEAVEGGKGQFTKMRVAPRPFDIDQTSDSGLWNSLCDLGGDTFLCVSQQKGRIVTAKGRIVKK